MAFVIDRKLVEKLENDLDFQKIKGTLRYPDDRIFKHAWVFYQAKDNAKPLKWHPVLIKDQDSQKVGFEYNPGGWKSKKEAGKVKLSLQEFLSIIINGSFNRSDTVRCKYSDSSSPDGRNVGDMEFDAELAELINNYQSSPTISGLENSAIEKPSNTPAFSNDQKALATQAVEEINSLLKGFSGQEKDIIAKYRTNQGKFRKILLDYWDGACAVSGLRDERLLIASHILPWSKSNEHQKGDPCNGLLLSVVWDALFDKGLIAFDDEGKAILNKLDNDVIHRLGLNEETSLIMSNKLTKEHRQYLQMHRTLHEFY